MPGRYSFPYRRPAYGQRASVLAISLWILVILAMFAVSVGHRVSIGLKISRRYEEGLKALYLAKAAVNRMIAEIENDKEPSFDALTEGWAHNPELFKSFPPDGNKDEYASISYLMSDLTGSKTSVFYGASDECGKININEALEPVLTQVFRNCGIDPAKSQELAQDVILWRSAAVDQALDDYYETTLGYPRKKKAFTVPEELILVKGMKDIKDIEKKLEKIKELITVYGPGKVNINTAPEEVLEILGLYAVSLLDIPPGSTTYNAGNVRALIDAFRAFRSAGGNFVASDIETGGIGAKLGLDPDSNEAKIAARMALENLLTVISSYFRIDAMGNSKNVSRNVTVIYNRDSDRAVFWHEN